MITKINGNLFADMIIQGAQNLSNNADMVDALNVYPVPDGDTGTNMNLSMTSGREEVQAHLTAHIGNLGKAFSKGLLMGARGNSGVILSQIFRGFSKALEDKEEIDVKQFAESFEAGVKTAYKAVMKPVEGTILTVAKDAGAAAVKKAQETDDCLEVMAYVYEEAQKSLENTPNLLPVLKEVGVVDSGGKGLTLVYEGFLKAMKGEKIVAEAPKVDRETFFNDEHDFHGVIDTDDIVYGYCTEMMVRFEADKAPFDEADFRQEMSQFGDSLLVISDDEIVKVHVHTETPGEVFSFGQKYGELIKVKAENMREQHREVLRKEAAHQSKTKNTNDTTQTVETAVITISMGDGITKLFKSMGATHVISGGQTMNPSTEDIVKVINDSGCKRAIILPNNKNIQMASQQAADIVEVETIIIPTRTVPQGIAAMFHYDESADLATNEEAMTAAIDDIQSGAMTYAVRDTKIDGIEIEKGAFMGLVEDKIIASDRDKQTVLKDTLNHMLSEDSEILTIITGEEAESELTDWIETFVGEHYEDVEVEVQDGQQPIYPYLFAVE
ncbi:TPA: fatty acid kinase catalytic subunit FakA [Staphylococcus pseudintermedius]|uniref:fatty acid kinase catalytic subunit FakA n=1 Tax=Staphylococcus pseudintermedius TaxID=283734 RepID=UPI001035D82D|nr:fatty acid kinase catalytic subunit FakA [Staphylococcus pseudintermedius]EGQ3294647.1 DAK2 domain-containing protein [Staphylococcus pseudintermedius]EGQ3874641.1 DAK2 domain-containing protein [Staphylococcus pseudintermedius]EIQ0621912.1 fatty acid kinase catalytic subunit FakA [Staphylococcus pseudintermedius]EIX6371969.1 fatty acid kinase catalytic subunit FakA [Staphylococcus pseudintermedius]ELP8689524.1 fatty acid kinase catalytic subunit FakA [Staphylococcus pseudintermedius]